MVKLQAIYSTKKSRSMLKHLAVGFTLLFITAQPTLNVLFNLVETEYELCETHDDEEIEKKEKLKEKKAEEDKFYNPSFFSSYKLPYLLSSIHKTCSYSKNDTYFIEYNLEVPCPPPQWS